MEFIKLVKIALSYDKSSSGSTLCVDTKVANFFKTFYRFEKITALGFFLCLDRILDPVVSFLRVFAFLIRPFRSPKRPLINDVMRLCLIFQTLLLLRSVHASKAYHIVRGQSTLKLYVIIGILQNFDVLCSNLGVYVCHVLFRIESEKPNLSFVRVYVITSLYVAAHSLIIFASLVTLNAAMNSKTETIISLFFLNNMAELKGFVFKNYSQKRVIDVLFLDIVERFSVVCTLGLIFFHHTSNFPVNADWVFSFLKLSAFYIFLEVAVDFFKHAFVCLRNEIDPKVYSRMYDILCAEYVGSLVDGGANSLFLGVEERMSFPTIPFTVVIWKTIIWKMEFGTVFVGVLVATVLCKVILVLCLVRVSAENVLSRRD